MVKTGSYYFLSRPRRFGKSPLISTLEERFYHVITKAYEKTDRPVVILVDEYDKPLLQAIDNEDLQTKKWKKALQKKLLPFCSSVDRVESNFQISKFVKEVENREVDAFFRRLQSFFADTPYELVKDLELHYQNVLFIVFKLVGFYVKAEYHTSEGRIDLLLQTDNQSRNIEKRIVRWQPITSMSIYVPINATKHIVQVFV